MKLGILDSLCWEQNQRSFQAPEGVVPPLQLSATGWEINLWQVLTDWIFPLMTGKIWFESQV